MCHISFGVLSEWVKAMGIIPGGQTFLNRPFGLDPSIKKFPLSLREPWGNQAEP